MNFELNEDQREIKRTAREWLAARYPIARVREIALDGAKDDTWNEIFELGWPEIADFGLVELAVVAEELGASLAPTPLAAHWTAKLLHPGLAGRGTVAMWDGPDGEKIAVPAADVADTFIVRRDGRDFAVPSREVHASRAEALDPTRPLFTVRAGEGEDVSGDHSESAWLGCYVAAAADSVGVAARVTAMTVEYAKERKQFGRPIGSYQAISHACAEMFLAVEGARNVVYWAAWALENDPSVARLAAHSAKAAASDAAVNVCRSSMQVHGGIGFTWEHDLHLYLKRAESNARAFGDATWHREQVAGVYL